MTDVLMGRTPSPIGYHTEALHELANAYYARAAEITMKLQRLEREGHVLRGSNTYKFRTGELRTFMEMAAKADALGSRRITVAKMEYDQQREGVL